MINCVEIFLSLHCTRTTCHSLYPVLCRASIPQRTRAGHGPVLPCAPSLSPRPAAATHAAAHPIDALPRARSTVPTCYCTVQ
eukprot:gene16117-biopygen21769